MKIHIPLSLDGYSCGKDMRRVNVYLFASLERVDRWSFLWHSGECIRLRYSWIIRLCQVFQVQSYKTRRQVNGSRVPHQCSMFTYGTTFLTACNRNYQSELDPRRHWKLCRVAVIHFLAVRTNEKKLCIAGTESSTWYMCNLICQQFFNQWLIVNRVPKNCSRNTIWYVERPHIWR